MNTRAILYAGFLTAAVAVLLASGRFRRHSHTDTSAAVAANR